MKARDIMTAPVYVIAAGRSLEDAAGLMLAHRIGCLPVTDSQDNLVGILTESDFAARQHGIPFSLYRYPQVFGQWMPKHGVEKMYAAARSRHVGDFMSQPAVHVDAEADLAMVLDTMLNSGYHRLPVVSGGKVVGIIARHDLLRLMFQVEPAALRRENKWTASGIKSPSSPEAPWASAVRPASYLPARERTSP